MAEEEFPLYPAAIYLPPIAGLAIILDVPPLIWHVRNHNLAAAALVGWFIAYNFFALINALIWGNEDVRHWFPGYGVCDVEVYVMVAGWTGISTALLCIMRGLAKVLDTKNQVVRPCRAQRIRQYLIDAIICWAPPILQLGLFDIVKVYRYYIYDISGCVPAIDNSLVGVGLIYIWPLVIDFVVGYYAVLVIVRMHRYRAEFSRLVHSHNTTRSRFLRLFLLSTLILLGILPAQATILYLNLLHPFLKYSWSRNHDPVQRATIQPYLTHGEPIPDRWVSLACGFLLFLFFGLGTDASDMYRSWAKNLSPARLFKRSDGHPHQGMFHIIRNGGSSSGSSSGNTPISPSARSTFSCKTYLTSSTTTARSNSTAGSGGKSFFSLSKSLCKSPLDLWRTSAGADTTTTSSNNTRSGSTAPILPLHHHRHPDSSDGNRNARIPSIATATTAAPSAALAPPTIDTSISMTPLAKAIRKASVGTLIEDDDDDATTVSGSPVVVVDDLEKSGGGGGGGSVSAGIRRTGELQGLGIEMVGMRSPRTEL
ncbi:a-pheromone receptor [Diplodia corticola]|uniref:A-pheromone receptor n=1 Tax=Diplodia corticola TaxID=236234 RepID=A0A1J9RGA4_9PEZI|nr:a-pheromone receptor [Diplodia corticola]OJD31571.1 a-pheromone receptor [Diplodia corticola]